MKNTEENYKRPKLGPAVICDFDDTTVLENVAEILLKEFGGHDWRKYQRQNSGHRISLMEYQELAFQTVKVGRETMKDLVKERATLRPYFKALYEYCQRQNIPIAIATMGLDFYVEALLEREGMDSIPYYAVDTEFTDSGIKYGYRYTWDGCWQPGNCKCRALEEYRRKGHTILFAGDGNSDICPADKSDVVFARRFLEDHCQENGLPYVPLTDFSKVIESLESLTSTGTEKSKDD